MGRDLNLCIHCTLWENEAATETVNRTLPWANKPVDERTAKTAGQTRPPCSLTDDVVRKRNVYRSGGGRHEAIIQS